MITTARILMQRHRRIPMLRAMLILTALIAGTDTFPRTAREWSIRVIRASTGRAIPTATIAIGRDVSNACQLARSIVKANVLRARRGALR